MSWWNRIINALNSRRLDEDLTEEIRHHLDLRAAEYEAEGLIRREAERRAAVFFGNASRIREDSRDFRLWPALESTCQDVRYAWRGMWRSPVFSLAAVLSLSVAIGANTSIYSIVDALLLR